jgi:signal peptidase II
MNSTAVLFGSYPHKIPTNPRYRGIWETSGLNFIKQRKKFISLVFVIFCINYFFDKLTKYIAITYLKGHEAIPLFNDTVIIKYAENTGAFLSLGSNWNIYVKYIVFLIIPIIICLTGVIYLIVKETKTHRIITGSCIIGGGIGNLTDRLFNEFKVIDFFNLGVGAIRTGILNMADLSVTFGVILLLFFEDSVERKKKSQEITNEYS